MLVMSIYLSGLTFFNSGYFYKEKRFCVITVRKVRREKLDAEVYSLWKGRIYGKRQK